jgi:hypothetical protein
MVKGGACCRTPLQQLAGNAFIDPGKEPIISEEEANKTLLKLNFNLKVTRLPYYTG